MEMSRLPPAASAPRLQGKAVVQAPTLDTKVSPAGGVLLTVTLVASDGPLLVMVATYCTFPPTWKLAGGASAAAMSALKLTSALMLALLLVRSGSVVDAVTEALATIAPGP